MNNLEFALEMKNKRLASGLSQGELASLTHVSRYSINRFENGKANASKETQNIILRCLNYYVCDKPFYLLVDYLSVRFPTTDALEVIRKVLGMKADYFIHYDYGYYGYKEHYAYGEIKVMASDDEHMGVFLKNPCLHTDEVLIALSATAAQSEDAQKALSCLPQLKGCQVHSSVMLSDVDRKMFQRLGCDLTCEPKFQ